MQTTPIEIVRQYEQLGWWGERTFMDTFDEAVADAGDQLALVDPPNRADIMAGQVKRLTFKEVCERADALALLLQAGGVGQGDKIIVQLPNVAELPIAYVALGRLGAIISPVACQYGRFELAGIAKALDAKAVLTMGRFMGKEFLDERRSAFGPDITIFAFDGEGRDGVIALPDDLLTAAGALSAAPAPKGLIGKLFGAGKSEAPAPPRAKVDANDVYTICWTSGTTGLPKGVPRHHNHWFCQSMAVSEAVPVTAGEAMLNPFPLINMAALSGFFFMWPIRRARLVLHHPFDLNVFLQQMKDEEIVYTIAPPAILSLILQRTDLHDKIDLSAARHIASGSAPLAPSMVKGFSDLFGVEIINFFGSNEGMGLVGSARDIPDPELRATYFPRFGRDDIQWSNKFSSQCRTKLVDWQNDDVEITEPGVSGELLITGPNVFDGYLNDGRDHSDVFDKDGYFRSGDLFEIAGEGELSRFYRYVGRRKELIIRGGMNISPEELDAALAGHPKLVEAAVVGYPDEVMGEKVAAIVVPKDGENVTLEDITGYLEGLGMAKFKWPERVVTTDVLPRNPLNKVVRVELEKFL